jgi:hypothetical protein
LNFSEIKGITLKNIMNRIVSYDTRLNWAISTYMLIKIEHNKDHRSSTL